VEGWEKKEKQASLQWRELSSFSEKCSRGLQRTLAATSAGEVCEMLKTEDGRGMLPRLNK
jgi:hypothetical protein